MTQNKDNVCLLIDLYGELLTKKQFEVMNAYYNEDNSLSEIAEILNVTKQAVKDALDKSIAMLVKYEHSLHLAEKYKLYWQTKGQFSKMTKKELIAFIESLF